MLELRNYFGNEELENFQNTQSILKINHDTRHELKKAHRSRVKLEIARERKNEIRPHHFTFKLSATWFNSGIENIKKQRGN